MRGHCRSDNLIEDYCDGSTFKNHPLFPVDLTALQIMFYYDNLEVCNPIGSRAKKHKLGKYYLCGYILKVLYFGGVFYHILGNIPPNRDHHLKLYSLLQLCAIHYFRSMGSTKYLNLLRKVSKSLKRYNYNVYSIYNGLWFQQDEGVDLTIKGQQYNFRGTITIVCADNLASWFLGGYKALASALRKCRFCMAIAEDMSSKVGSLCYLQSCMCVCFSFFRRNFSLVLALHMQTMSPTLVGHYKTILLQHMALLETLFSINHNSFM